MTASIEDLQSALAGTIDERVLAETIETAAGQTASLAIRRPHDDPDAALLDRFGFYVVDEEGEDVLRARRLPGVGRKVPDGDLRQRTRRSGYLWHRDDHGVLACRLSAAPLNAGWWTLPGGGVEDDETVESAVVREVEEETGLAAEVGDEIAHTQFTLRWFAEDGVPEEYTVDQRVFDGSVSTGALRDETGGSTNRAARLDPSQFWRLPLVPVAVAGAQRGLRLGSNIDAREIVAVHAAAVRTRRPDLMVADYADDARLERGNESYTGVDAIHAYFTTVPSRVGAGHVHLGVPELDGRGTISLPWRIYGGPGHGAGGVDAFTVRGGFIVEQTVRLTGADF